MMRICTGSAKRYFIIPSLAIATVALCLVFPATTNAWPPLKESMTAKDAEPEPRPGDERITIGPMSAHAFQRQAKDDPGTDLTAEKINLSQLLETLGPQARDWYQHVITLADPYFEGRAPGTRGVERAAEYIEFYFKSFGLEPAFPDLSEGEVDALDQSTWTSYRQPFEIGNRPELATDNVGGVLPGKGMLANEWVIIGAHYDHVGYGRPGRTADDAPVHPGADDNASGTAAMMILAERFADAYANAPEDANLRSILFMAFSAEEMGLLGSRHYVRNSTLNADDVQIMINLDMIGRLRGNKLMVQGVDSAENLYEIIRDELVESEMLIHADPNGRGPSDHASFYGGGIPVLFFFTGTHDVYHQPGDVALTVNPRGASAIIDLVYNIIDKLLKLPEHLEYKRFQPQR